MKKQLLLFTAIVLFAFSKSYSQELPMRGIGSINQILKVNNNNGAQLLMRPSVIYEFDSKIGIGIDKPKYKFHVDGSIMANNDIKGNAIYGDIKTQSIQPSTYPNSISISATTDDNRFLLKSDGNYALGPISENYGNQLAMFDILSSAIDTYTTSIANYNQNIGKGLFISTMGNFPSQDIPLAIFHQDNIRFSVSGNGDVDFTGNLTQNGQPFISSKWIEQDDNIYFNSGNVGIGLDGPASSPNSKLHLFQMGSSGPALRLENFLGVPGSPNYCWDIENNLTEFAIAYGEGNLGGSNPTMTKMMVINNSGNVGIGISDPVSMLQVEGYPGDQNWLVDLHNNQQLGAVYGLRLRCDSPDYGHDDKLFEVVSYFGTSLLVNGDGNVGIGTTAINSKLEVNGTVSATSFSGDGSNLSNVDDGDWYFSGNDIYTNTNVGIGIDPPSEKLHVNGNQILTGTLDVDGTSYLNGIILDNDADITNADQIVGYNDLRLSGDNNGGTDIYIDTDGNVGIGTTNPDAPLCVNGRIKTEEIEVVGNVPSSDFVFEEDYDLMDLQTLEQFVKENKHLPEIPSAEEFKTNGYNMNDMDDLLLRKVEELTLHIIALEKMIFELKKK